MKGLRGDLLLTLFSHLLTKPLWLIADNLAQDRLGHETYGLIGALNSLASWANVIADWSLSYHITRRVAQSPHLTGAIAAETLLPKLLLSLLAWAAFLGAGYVLGYAWQSLLWLSGLLAYQIILASIQYFRSFFQGQQLFRADALLGNIEKGMIIILLAVFWPQLSGGLYIGLMVGGSSLALGLIAVWAWKRFQLRGGALQLKDLSGLLNRLTPYAALVLISSLNERLNQVLVERMVGPYENGLYLGAYRWFSASMMYLWIVLPLFYARFALLGRQPTPLLWRTFVMGQISAAVPLLAVTLIMLVEPRLFLILFRHSNEGELEAMAAHLRLLAGACTLNALFNIYSTHLTANGREKVTLLIMLMATATNLLLCWLGIPVLKAMGGTLALLSSYAVFSVGYYVVFRRWVGLEGPPITWPWKMLSWWIAIGLGITLLRSYLPPLPPGSWSVIAITAYGGMLYFSGTLHLWRRVSRL